MKNFYGVKICQCRCNRADPALDQKRLPSSPKHTFRSTMLVPSPTASTVPRPFPVAVSLVYLARLFRATVARGSVGECHTPPPTERSPPGNFCPEPNDEGFRDLLFFSSFLYVPFLAGFSLPHLDEIFCNPFRPPLPCRR